MRLEYQGQLRSYRTASETPWTQRASRPARRLAWGGAFSLATSDRVERAVLASPMLQKAAFRQAKRYIAGLDEQVALATVRTLSSDGLAASVDLFGENVDDTPHAELATDRYMALAAQLAAHAGTDLSLDCSHLGLDRDSAACHERVQRIAHTLPAGTRLQLGAEQSSRTSATPDCGVVRTARRASRRRIHRSVT